MCCFVSVNCIGHDFIYDVQCRNHYIDRVIPALLSNDVFTNQSSGFKPVKSDVLHSTICYSRVNNSHISFSSTDISKMDLTPTQRTAIQQTWAIPAENPIDSGESILLAYFERFPHNQQKFLAFRNVPAESLKVNMSKNQHNIHHVPPIPILRNNNKAAIFTSSQIKISSSNSLTFSDFWTRFEK